VEEFTTEHQEEPASKTQFVVNAVWDLAITVLPALLVALFINVFVAEAALVERGPSMEPNLYRGYRVMTEKVSYLLHPPSRGDVVIADRPGSEVALIKRVVALPGETVEVRGGRGAVGDQLRWAKLSADGRAVGSRVHPGRQSQQLARLPRHRAGAAGYD